MSRPTTETVPTEPTAPLPPSEPQAGDASAELRDVVEAVVEVAVDQPATRTFADFGVRPDIVQALSDVGITSPFPIQAMALPVGLDGHDIIGQAKTGTGKTLGFAIPMLQRTVAPSDPGFAALPAPGKPQALAVVPTRELAVQVAGDLEATAARSSTRVLTVYGGRAYEPQVEALRRGVEVIVGTPGRLLDLAQQGHLDLSHVQVLVLDEADEMLDLGFLPDVERLLALASPTRQMMMFSATMPGPVVSLARRFMSQPTHIRAIDPADDGATLKAITQLVYRAHAMDKVEMLARILQSRGRGLTMIFARTKRTVAKVADDLTERGFATAAIHGDLGQGAREQALRAFRNGKVDVLVATDVAARGIDVEGITHVVNYQCPEDEKTYLHRIGRTGRAGRTGVAVTLVDWDDLPRWGLINKILDLGIPEPVETYSNSPHLYAELDIPAGIKGTLPRGERIRQGLGAEQVEDLGETGKRSSTPPASPSHSAARARSGAPAGGRGERGERGAGRPARERSRRRTRGAQEPSPGASGAPQTTSGASAGPPSSESPTKRRRHRGGRGRGSSSSAEQAPPSPVLD